MKKEFAEVEIELIELQEYDVLTESDVEQIGDDNDDE